MIEPQVLCHYNTELPVRLDTDASSYGIGVVLFYILPDGNENPISYASKMLNEFPNKRSSQIEIEAYAIVFAVI